MDIITMLLYMNPYDYLNTQYNVKQKLQQKVQRKIQYNIQQTCVLTCKLHNKSTTAYRMSYVR